MKNSHQNNSPRPWSPSSQHMGFTQLNPAREVIRACSKISTGEKPSRIINFRYAKQKNEAREKVYNQANILGFNKFTYLAL